MNRSTDPSPRDRRGFRAPTRLSASVAAGVLLLGVLVALPASPAAADPVGPEVIDAWAVTGPATWPGGPEVSAERPALVRAPNGDLLAAFNTTGDAMPGGELQMIRSSDDGATWSAAEVIATPTLYGPSGSVASTRGMTVLSDGFILLPFNQAVVHSAFTNVESTLYIARSTDSGVTWSDVYTPVTLPSYRRVAASDGGNIKELPNGDLLLGVYGEKALAAEWQKDPMRWGAGVLKSTDGGLTWSSFVEFAFDPNNPPPEPTYPGGANEFALWQLPDGRIMAQLRFAEAIGATRAQTYLTYSSDGGDTWTPPVATGYSAEALAIDAEYCPPVSGRNVLVMGHREVTASGVRTGRALLATSYDDGVTWQQVDEFEDEFGNTTGLGAATGEPDFALLGGDRWLALFQVLVPGTDRFKIVANVIDMHSDDCAALLAAADARHASDPLVFVQRADRAEWAWPYASRPFDTTPTTTVGDFTGQVAHAMNCIPSPTMRLALASSPGTYLSPSATLSAAGIGHGTVVQLDDADPGPNPFRVGFMPKDVYPDERNLGNWDSACETAPIAIDSDATSLGLDVDYPLGSSTVDAIELVNRWSTTRLTAGDYTVWQSDDNESFTQVTGWSFSTHLESGRLVHRFDDLGVTERYVKVNQPYGDTSYTFVIDEPRSDVRVEFAP